MTGILSYYEIEFRNKKKKLFKIKIKSKHFNSPSIIYTVMCVIFLSVYFQSDECNPHIN